MQNKIKKIFQYILGELIILFVPKKLSTLHIASFYKNSIIEDKKETLKLSKKMRNIKTRLSSDNLDLYKDNNIKSNIQLFYCQ